MRELLLAAMHGTAADLRCCGDHRPQSAHACYARHAPAAVDCNRGCPCAPMAFVGTARFAINCNQSLHSSSGANLCR